MAVCIDARNVKTFSFGQLRFKRSLHEANAAYQLEYASRNLAILVIVHAVGARSKAIVTVQNLDNCAIGGFELLGWDREIGVATLLACNRCRRPQPALAVQM